MLKTMYALKIKGRQTSLDKINPSAYSNEIKNTGYYISPVGMLEIVSNDRAILSIKKVKEDNGLHSNLHNKEAITTKVLLQAKIELEEYFSGERQYFEFPMELIGTKFQVSVWKALYDIPFGVSSSYKDIAIKVGNPKSCRAIGGANNKNPISIAVPCHRVIGSDGSLTGYGGGLDMKKSLLKHEGIHFLQSS